MLLARREGHAHPETCAHRSASEPRRRCRIFTSSPGTLVTSPLTHTPTHTTTHIQNTTVEVLICTPLQTADCTLGRTKKSKIKTHQAHIFRCQRRRFTLSFWSSLIETDNTNTQSGTDTKQTRNMHTSAPRSPHPHHSAHTHVLSSLSECSQTHNGSWALLQHVDVQSNTPASHYSFIHSFINCLLQQNDEALMNASQR